MKNQKAKSMFDESLTNLEHQDNSQAHTIQK